MNDDRELWAVLVALEPLDDRKWDYLDLTHRTFDADGLLEQPWSSGECVLVEVAASLWNTGKVDIGYIACAMGGRHFQAIIDAIAVRAGHGFASRADAAIARVAVDTLPTRDRLTHNVGRSGGREAPQRHEPHGASGGRDL